MPHSDLTDRARELRARQTNAEARLWQALRNRRLDGWKFKRQVPKGPYIVDFLCAEAGLVVEVDGWTHSEDRELAYDARRTAFLESLDLRVLRVTNRAVYDHLSDVCAAILAALNGEAPHPALSPLFAPLGGRGG